MPAFSTKEQERLSVIQNAIKGTITNEVAAKQLHLSIRQIKRLKQRVRDNGDTAIKHQLKGKESNHRIDDTVKEEAVKLLKKEYADFKPTFASEKLAENHQITISYQTARRWMTKEGLWKPRKQKQRTYRSWRPRKEYYGELQQFDGSYHLWLELRCCDENGEPIELCLLLAVDDATGEITKASFADNEGVIAVFTFWKDYVETKGKPKHLYLDKFSTYKINHKKAVDNHELLTQFQRAMQQLGITLIPANSPQAKGRVERLNATLQDRLVKELRLANITTPREANRFLQDVFIPKYNERFAVIAAKEGDVHTPLQKEEKDNLNHIFSLHERRKINNDFTIQFKNTWYQLQEIQPTTVRARMTVSMETWLDGTIHIMLNQHELTYVILPEKPQKQSSIKQPTILTTHKLNYKPPANHPWRKYPQNSTTS